MSSFTPEQIEETAKKIVATLEDGFQWTDLIEVVPRVMEIVEQVEGMSGEQKHETAGALLDYVIDNTDTPWVPDSLTDPLLKKGLRALFPIIAAAAKGDLKINEGSE